MSKRQTGKAFWEAGFPLLILVCGGTWGLATLLQGKFATKEAQNRALAISHTQKGPKRSLEEELEVLRNRADIENYLNKPVPRPESSES